MNKVNWLVSKYFYFLFLIFILSTIGSKASANDLTGDVNVFLGVKKLDKSDWEPLEEQNEFGIDIDFKQSNWPVSVAVGYLSSSTDDTVSLSGIKASIEGKTSELYVGARKIFEQSAQFRPFVSIGLASIRAEASTKAFGSKATNDDSSIGYWIDGGFYFTIAKHYNIGASIRYSDAEVTMNNVDGKAGGLHYGVLAGYHW